MPVPSFNTIGGVFAVLGLAGVVYFGAHAADCPPLAPAAVVAPTAVAPPAPVAPPSAPASTVAPKKRPLTFRTVKKMDCKWVPAVTKDYSKEQITIAAQQYGLSPAQVSALRACLN